MDTYVSGEPVYSLMFRPGRYDYDDYGFWRDVWSTDDVKLGSVMIGNVGIDESVPGVVSYKPADWFTRADLIIALQEEWACSIYEHSFYYSS